MLKQFGIFICLEYSTKDLAYCRLGLLGFGLRHMEIIPLCMACDYLKEKAILFFIVTFATIKESYIFNEF